MRMWIGGLICLGRLERASLNKWQSSWGLKDEYEGAKKGEGPFAGEGAECEWRD